MDPQTPAKPQMRTRPPVVVVLGHVDHGKTQLLDTIRKTTVASHESGGITQHIGAYQVEANGKLITFLDTPGHEAFAAIRSRGAKVADVAILVIAADESVKPQTKEAIRIIKEAEIPFIVAINKIDRENANPQKVRQDLAAEEVLVEGWGGNVPVVEISARNNTNIPELLDMILLVAELEELHEDLTPPAQGTIIESSLDRRRGHVATALVQKGVLRVGDWIVVGRIVGKVKSMEDFMGKSVSEALPSQPVRITGWPGAPDIGKPFATAPSKDAAQEIADTAVSFAPLLLFMRETHTPTGAQKILRLVCKSDVQSSLEAIDAALKTIISPEVTYEVLDYGIGNINETDVKIAIRTKAFILGFRVGIEDPARRLAERDGIQLKTFDIIYDLINAVRDEMSNLLEPELKRTLLGKLRVLAIFKKDGRSLVLGGRVTSGSVLRGAKADILRDGSIIASGRLAQLQQNKEDVSEVREGLDAGLRLELNDANSDEIREGDIVEVYEEEKIKRSL